MSDAQNTGPQERGHGVTEGSHTASGIRVKKLEWRKANEVHWTARAPVGSFHVFQTPNKLFGCVYQGEVVGRDLPTLEEAKAACQSDFQRRITECLEDDVHSVDTNPHTVDATGWRDISTAPKDGTKVRLLGSEGAGFGTYHTQGDTIFKGGWRMPGDMFRYPACGSNPTHWMPAEEPLPPPPGEEGESERERIAHELREHADKQGDPSGWLEVIAIAIETGWSVINDPENFKNEPCRFAVMQERDALRARCDELEAAALKGLEHLIATVSVIERAEENGGYPSDQYGSDEMFQTAMCDFRKSIEAGREALSSAVGGVE